ncbi:MAG: hypothetical protein II350_05065, partial [Clostridia bacterium]|nr:hypothetical protein [Clostridia bacterium]
TRSDIAAELVKIRAKLEMLESWKELDIPLNTTGTRSTAIFIGSLPEEYSLSKLKEKLAAENPRFILTGGSDAHGNTTAGRGGISSPRRIKTEADLAAILKAKEHGIVR